MPTPAMNVLQRVLAAYGSQRDHIGDSDLDNEQPICLTVYMTLGDLRKMRMAVIQAGHRPADFDTKPRELLSSTLEAESTNPRKERENDERL